MSALKLNILFPALAVLSIAVLPAMAIETRFTGSTEIFGAAYTKHTDGLEDFYGDFHYKPKLVVLPDDQLLINVSADIRQDSAEYTHDIVNNISDMEPRRAMLELREAYIECTPSEMRLRIGNQIFDWSVTDTVSPADNLSPRDWTDVLRWERRGLPALDLQLGTDFFVETVIIPFFVPSIVPQEDSRWTRNLEPNLAYGSAEYPESVNPQFALRSGATWSGIDLGTSFFYGYSYSPFLKLESLQTNVILHHSYNREYVYTISTATEISGFSTRFEAGLFDQRTADQFMQFVVGIDREFSNVALSTDSLYILLQYADEKVLSRDNLYGVSSLDMRRIFTKCLMWKAKYSFDDSMTWSLKLEGVYNFEQRDNYIQPALAWKKESMELEFGVDILTGNPSTFFGGYGMNDRVYVKASYFF